MTHHVAMTYFGAPQRIEWCEGGRRESSITARGTITVIPAMHEARWDVHGPIEVSHVYISEARLSACADAVGLARGSELLDRVSFDEPIASRLLEILAIEAEEPDPSRRLAQEQTMDLLCMRLVQASSVVSTTPQEPKSRGLAPWQVKKITDYLSTHLARQVGLDELAALVGLSRFHICTAFRLATGMAPHQWLVHRRMTEAKTLLRDPSLSVTEIGFAVGYGSTSAFIAAFRKSTSVTPLRFRHQL
jgi:AraC family transcriptional regulator